MAIKESTQVTPLKAAGVIAAAVTVAAAFAVAAGALFRIGWDIGKGDK